MIGNSGQTLTLDPYIFASALTEYEKKFRYKTGLNWHLRAQQPKAGKHIFIERSYVSSDDEEDESPVEVSISNSGPTLFASHLLTQSTGATCTFSEPLKRLIRFIFDEKHFDLALHEIDYDS